ncbi:AbrB/MazE/SpoVT family DNA-binding domain-containing protein, partial [Candidatus Woesearchaeota archaeon]|nr:AbrB/MazE/SpoVT family DNA-binding domain-containing protein [Candidatus Woesearchaeota archaeon]
MKRKVIQLAGKTLLVSIPRKWARKLGIMKGDELELEEKDNRITITANKQTTLEKATLDAKNLDPQLLSWALGAIYKSGYDEIEVLYQSPETSRTIHTLTKDLFIGFAVTEQSASRSVIRGIAREIETEYEASLRRAFLVTLSMGESIHEYLKQGRTTQLGELLTLEQTNNQLINFCERILVKKGYTNYSKTCFAYVIAWNLEKICDNYKYLIAELTKRNAKPSNETLNLLDEANKLLRRYYELHYSNEKNKTGLLPEAMTLKKQAQEKCSRKWETATNDEKAMISHIQRHILLTADLTGPITGLSI